MKLQNLITFKKMKIIDRIEKDEFIYLKNNENEVLILNQYPIKTIPHFIPK